MWVWQLTVRWGSEAQFLPARPILDKNSKQEHIPDNICVKITLASQTCVKIDEKKNWDKISFKRENATP